MKNIKKRKETKFHHQNLQYICGYVEERERERERESWFMSINGLIDTPVLNVYIQEFCVYAVLYTVPIYAVKYLSSIVNIDLKNIDLR